MAAFPRKSLVIRALSFFPGRASNPSCPSRINEICYHVNSGVLRELLLSRDQTHSCEEGRPRLCQAKGELHDSFFFKERALRAAGSREEPPPRLSTLPPGFRRRRGPATGRISARGGSGPAPLFARAAGPGRAPAAPAGGGGREEEEEEEGASQPASQPAALPAPASASANPGGPPSSLLPGSAPPRPRREWQGGRLPGAAACGSAEAPAPLPGGLREGKGDRGEGSASASPRRAGNKGRG